MAAISQFNNQDWFECHETLEELWSGETGEKRELYQGILQIAVALHHWKSRNFGGAMSLFTSGMNHLGRVRPLSQLVDVTRLIADACRMQMELGNLGEERMTEIEPGLIPRLHIVQPGVPGR